MYTTSGINIRYLGLLRQQAKHPLWKSFFLSLALACVVKSILARQLRETLRSQKTSDISCRDIIASMNTFLFFSPFPPPPPSFSNSPPVRNVQSDTEQHDTTISIGGQFCIHEATRRFSWIRKIYSAYHLITYNIIRVIGDYFCCTSEKVSWYFHRRRKSRTGTVFLSQDDIHESNDCVADRIAAII